MCSRFPHQMDVGELFLGLRSPLVWPMILYLFWASCCVPLSASNPQFVSGVFDQDIWSLALHLSPLPLLEKLIFGQVYSPASWNVPSFSVKFHECLVIGILNSRGTSSLQPIGVMSELPRMWNCSMGQPKTTGPIPSWEEILLAKLGRQTNGQTNQVVSPTHMQTNLDAR